MGAARRRSNAITEDEIALLRARILQCTSHVVANMGVDKCSLSAVARAAGCSIGMIQHHFQTRDALVLASIAHRSDRLVDEWRRISASAADPVARIGALLALAVEGEESFVDAWGFWTQIYLVARRDPAVRDTIDATLRVWHALFAEALAEAQQAGIVSVDLDSQRLASYIVAAADGLAIQALGGFYGADSGTMHRDLVGLVARLLDIDPAALDHDRAGALGAGPAPVRR